jgi:multiple sugar transport system substrate-binding protein
MVKNRSKMIAILLFAAAAAITGCGSEGNKEAKPEAVTPPAAAPAAAVSTEPVTLKVLMPRWAFTDDEFKTFVVESVKKKHPNITLELSIAEININKLQEIVTQGIYPDIIITSSNIMAPLQSMGFESNMEPLLKANGFDTSKLQSGALQAVKTSSTSGQYIPTLPYTQNFSALYYNKDLFNKFGVAFPKDGLSWDEVTEIAKKLTRTDNGAAFYGLHPGKPTRTGSLLSLDIVDPKTSRAAVNNDGWKKNFEMQKAIFSIPGNAFVPESKAYDLFFKDKSLAMLASNNLISRINQAPDLNWDMVSYPFFKEKPNVSLNYDLHVMAVTPESKNRNAAFQVISTIVSDEVQLEMSKKGRVSVLQNQSVRDEFGKELASFKGKNISAIFKSTPAPAGQTSQFNSLVSEPVINTSLTKAILEQGVDINTALRQAEEQINKTVDQNKK